MKTDDTSNYHNWSGSSSIASRSGCTTAYDSDVWNFGKEIWCNMAGRYMHIVADLNHLSTAYTVSLCSVGIMGTQYVRD